MEGGSAVQGMEGMKTEGDSAVQGMEGMKTEGDSAVQGMEVMKMEGGSAAQGMAKEVRYMDKLRRDSRGCGGRYSGATVAAPGF